MQESELIALAEKIRELGTELPDVEVKAARMGCPKVFDSLSSFSNQSGGGTILFGLDESSGFAACGVYDAGDLMKQITNQCLQMEPVVRPLYTTATYQGATIVSAEIPEIEYDQRPCFYKGKGRQNGSYIRAGEQDLHMTEYEIYSYEAFRKKIQDELRPCQRATAQDLDQTALEKYMQMIRFKKPNLAQLGQEKALQMQGIMDENRPTLAGMMLFGVYPQGYYPQFCLTAVVVPGTEIGETGSAGERFIDNERIEGTLPQMLDRAMAFVLRNIPTATIIDPQTGNRTDKPMYPVTAIREILLNALIHRDYSIHTESVPIVLRLFEDRLELENPGGLYGRVTLDLLGRAIADTRNPFIAGAMELLALTENRYSGIPTIRREMRNYGLRPPEFEVIRGNFHVTLYNHRANDEKTGTGKIQQEIAEFCKTPRTRDELKNRFPQISPAYLMSRYINPMVQEDVIHLTIPEKPRSKFQQYYS